MSSSNSENEVEKVEEVKRKVGRPIVAHWRHNAETGKYNNNPTDPEYYKKYYHEKLSVKVQCPLCFREVCKMKLNRHQKFSLCLKNRKDTNIV